MFVSATTILSLGLGAAIVTSGSLPPPSSGHAEILLSVVLMLFGVASLFGEKRR